MMEPLSSVILTAYMCCEHIIYDIMHACMHACVNLTLSVCACIHCMCGCAHYNHVANIHMHCVSHAVSTSVNPSSTVIVTHSPVMEGGVNVAAAAAIPIIIILLILIAIMVIVLVARHIQKKKYTDIELIEYLENNISGSNNETTCCNLYTSLSISIGNGKFICKVFYYRLKQNHWKINYTFFPKEHLEVTTSAACIYCVIIYVYQTIIRYTILYFYNCMCRK